MSDGRRRLEYLQRERARYKARAQVWSEACQDVHRLLQDAETLDHSGLLKRVSDLWATYDLREEVDTRKAYRLHLQLRQIEEVIGSRVTEYDAEKAKEKPHGAH